MTKINVFARKHFMLGIAALLVGVSSLKAQVYSPAPNGYTVSGANVVGSGTDPNGAYFLDAGSTAYNITILSGADLGNITALGNSNELDFATGWFSTKVRCRPQNFGINFLTDGTVTNSGTIDGTAGGVVLNGNGTVVNTGLIEGPGGNAIQDIFTPTGAAGEVNRLTIDNNGGTLYSSVGHAIDDQNVLTSGTGSATAGQELSINNSGAINSGSDSIFVASGVTGDAASAVNRLDLTNSGLDPFVLERRGQCEQLLQPRTLWAAARSSSISTTADRSTGSLYGVSLSTANLSDGGSGRIDINFVNSGTITGGNNDIGVGLTEDSEFSGEGSSNSVQILNTGTITASSYAIQTNIDSLYNVGDVKTNVLIVNTNVITSANSYGIESEAYNYEDTGNATMIASAYNYGTITTYGPGNFDSVGMYLEPYNESDSGNGVVHVTMVNAGIINSVNDYGLSDYESGNYSEGGTAVSTVDVLNSGSIIGPDTGVYLYDGNEANHGDGLSTISFVNSGPVSAPGSTGYGAYIASFNDSSVTGNATTRVSFLNAAGATITSGETAVYEYASNSNNHGTSLDSSALQFINNGTLTSSVDYGADLAAGNINGAGSGSTTMAIANTNSIAGSTGGLRGVITNINTAGDSTSVLTMVNTGTIQGLAGRGVDLELEDTAIGGAGSGAITFVNGTAGSVSGTTTGLFITTSGITPSYTASVFNQGTIIGGTSGIELDTYYGTVVAAGGTISGGTNSVLLQGNNSTVTVQGRAAMIGTIQGSGLVGNTLNFDLMGMTPAQITAAKLAIATAAGRPRHLHRGEQHLFVRWI